MTVISVAVTQGVTSWSRSVLEDPSMTIFATVALFPSIQPTPTSAPPPPTVGSPTPSITSTDAGASGVAKWQRSLTSDVCQYLDALSKDIGGKPVRYGPRCKFCKKELSGKSTSGIGHFLRHVKSCLRKRQAATSSNQTGFILLLMVVWHTWSTTL
jgi:hypothetical protein